MSCPSGNAPGLWVQLLGQDTHPLRLRDCFLRPCGNSERTTRVQQAARRNSPERPEHTWNPGSERGHPSLSPRQPGKGG